MPDRKREESTIGRRGGTSVPNQESKFKKKQTREGAFVSAKRGRKFVAKRRKKDKGSEELQKRKTEKKLSPGNRKVGEKKLKKSKKDWHAAHSN